MQNVKQQLCQETQDTIKKTVTTASMTDGQGPKIFCFANNKPLSQIFKVLVAIVLQIATFKYLV